MVLITKEDYKKSLEDFGIKSCNVDVLYNENGYIIVVVYRQRWKLFLRRKEIFNHIMNSKPVNVRVEVVASAF